MSQTIVQWNFNGNTFELDLQDAETAERYEAAFDQMAKDEKDMPKDGTNSAYIKAYYQLFCDTYDAIFGKGSGVKIIGEKANARLCNDSYASFLEFVAIQKNANMEFTNTVISKYTQNRAQRRAAN